MTDKKRKFADKGQAILGNGDRPTGIGEILADMHSPSSTTETEGLPQSSGDTQEKHVNTVSRETVKTEKQEDGITAARTTDTTVNRKPGKPVSDKTVKPDTGDAEDAIDLPPKREEFKLPGQLAERLRVYVFNTRSKKTHVVIDALEEYLRKRGY